MPPCLPPRRPRDERGAVAVMVAVLATVLFVVAALVVDLGLARDTKRQSQVSADASALAAANVLYPVDGNCTDPGDVDGTACLRDAAEAARSYAGVNFGVGGDDWSGCTDAAALEVQDASTPCISFDDDTEPTQVRVRVPTRDIETGLGAVAGVDSIAVTTHAVAGSRAPVSVTCGLCFTGSIDTKKFKAKVDGGGIAVSGSVDLSPGGVPWTASSIQYGGGSFSGPVPSTTPKAIASFDDPWATNPALPPSTAGLDPKEPDADPCTSGPGIYGTHEFTKDCTFDSGGLYVFTGPLLSKNVVVKAPSTTFYFTCGTPTAPTVCGPDTSGGYLDLKNGDLQLTAPTLGPLAGLGIVYDREHNAPMELQGNGISNVTGSIYAPSSTLAYNGTSDVVVTGGPVVLDAMTGNGTTGVWVKSSDDVTITKVPGEVSLAE